MTPLAVGMAHSRPLAIDLFTGLHGWAVGLTAEGFDIVGFDLEDMCEQFNQPRPDHVHLVIQDVLTLHGAQFKDAALIVASPPCQEYSYMAMPWKRAKAKAVAIRADTSGQKLADLNRLFDACFRIQREACEAAGRHIPMVVENVRGAIPWVGRSRWNFGSFHLWGDVPALMPTTLRAQKFNPDGTNHGQGSWFAIANSKKRGAHKVPGFRFDGSGCSFQSASVAESGFKSSGMNWSDQTKRGQDFTRIAGKQAMDGLKSVQDGLGGYGGNFGWNNTPMRRGNSKRTARKAASAMIAKIPEPLARHIARTFYPTQQRAVA